MKVLVTGATGFVGRNLLESGVLEGREVTLFVRDPSRAPPGYPIIVGDMRDLPACQKATEGMDLVIHLAGALGGTKSLRDPWGVINLNFCGTLNILEGMRLNGVERMIYTSSIGVYGNNAFAKEEEIEKLDPLTPYDASKLFCEELIRAYARYFGMKPTILRISYLYGRYQNKDALLENFAKRVREGAVVEIGNDVTRDFLNVADLPPLFGRLLDFGGEGTFNVGSGVETRISEVVKTTATVLGKEIEVRQDPGLMRDKRLEKWHERANIEKVIKTLGWKPSLSLREGIEMWLRT